MQGIVHKYRSVFWMLSHCCISSMCNLLLPISVCSLCGLCGVFSSVWLYPSLGGSQWGSLGGGLPVAGARGRHGSEGPWGEYSLLLSPRYKRKWEYLPIFIIDIAVCSAVLCFESILWICVTSALYAYCLNSIWSIGPRVLLKCTFSNIHS